MSPNCFGVNDILSKAIEKTWVGINEWRLIPSLSGAHFVCTGQILSIMHICF